MQLKFGGQFIHRLKETKNKVFWTILSWLFWGLILNKSLCNSHCNHYSFAFELWPKMPLTNHIVSLVSQDIIKRWSWFSTCDHTFLDPTNHFNHFAFASSGKHLFPDDSNHVINGDHNDDNSDNYVDYNNENDVNFMVIMIESGPRNLKGYLWKSSFLVKLQS